MLKPMQPWRDDRGPLIDKYDPWLPMLLRVRTAPSPITAQEMWGARPPLAVYVHIPFCVERCSYCDFTAYAGRSPGEIEEYVAMVRREIALCAAVPHLQGRRVSALYFGGGTPSRIPTALIEGIVHTLRENFELTADCEFCLEANPSDLDAPKLKELERLGVNRLSVGVQSFDDAILRAMNRSHTSEEAISAIRRARDQGLALNIDLIYGYPGQTLADWETSLEWTVRLGVERLTCTSLTVWPRTAVWHQLNEGAAQNLAEETERRMFDMSIDAMQEAGYEQSTVLSFCLAPRYVWRLQRDVLAGDAEMIGLGASAFSLTREWAYVNAPSLRGYVKSLQSDRIPVAIAYPIDAEQAMSLALVQGLKLISLDAGKFKRRFGVDLRTMYGETLDRLSAAGMVTCEGEQVRLTRDGMWHMGPVLREFYSSDDRRAWQTFATEKVAEAR